VNTNGNVLGVERKHVIGVLLLCIGVALGVTSANAQPHHPATCVRTLK